MTKVVTLKPVPEGMSPDITAAIIKELRHVADLLEKGKATACVVGYLDKAADDDGEPTYYTSRTGKLVDQVLLATTLHKRAVDAWISND
jgi:hypothetical protein